MFSIIAAIGKNGELGLKGKLVFHIKEDMKFFRETTKGHRVVMGSKTWESLPGKLPGRENIVIYSREFAGPDRIIHDVNDFIKENLASEEEIFVIGGAKVYKKFLPFAKRLYLTEIDAVAEADAYFPCFKCEKYDIITLKQGIGNGARYVINQYIKKGVVK